MEHWQNKIINNAALHHIRFRGHQTNGSGTFIYFSYATAEMTPRHVQLLRRRLW